MKRTVRFFKFEKGKWWLTCPGISSIVLSKISPWSPNSEKLSKQLLALLNGFPDNANAHGWEVCFPKCSWRNWLQKMNGEIYEMLRCQYSFTSVGVALPTHVPKIRRLSVIFICLSTRGQAVRSQWQSWQVFLLKGINESIWIESLAIPHLLRPPLPACTAWECA